MLSWNVGIANASCEENQSNLTPESFLLFACDVCFAWFGCFHVANDDIQTEVPRLNLTIGDGTAEYLRRHFGSSFFL